MQREDYPNPIYIRPRLKLLNGDWGFEADPKDNIADILGRPLAGKITLPYPFGSSASGVTATGTERSVWYRRSFTLNRFDISGTVILNFTAIDYRCEAYVNGYYVGASKGGYAPVKFNITPYLRDGENSVTVNALDDHGDPQIPSGDQKKSYGDGRYAPTIGIRGDVWLEFTAKTYFGFLRSYASFRDKTIYVQGNIAGDTQNAKVKVEIAYGKKQIASYNYKATETLNVKAPLPSGTVFLWAPGESRIYDVRVSLYNANGGLADMIYTYCAFREINFLDKKLYVNGSPVFLKSLENNGIYPETGYVPRDAKAVAKDVALAMALGFNAFDFVGRYPLPKELYICDKLGMAVRVGLMSGGAKLAEPNAKNAFLAETSTLIQYDFGHPCILFWIPFVNYNYDGALQKETYSLIKSIDPTRPVTVSGGRLYASDLYEFRYAENELLPMLYERFNGSVADEKEEKKFLKAYPDAVKREVLNKLPMYVTELTVGEFKRNEYYNEKAFIENYRRLSAIIFGSGAIGFTLKKFYDVGSEKCAVSDEEHIVKLSREGTRALIEINANLVVKRQPPNGSGIPQ